MGNDIKSIGEYAFSQCASLTSIELPNGVTSIGESAFNYCTSLSHIVIPNSVENIGVSAIGEWAFRGCTSLTSITIPSNVTIIYGGAFANCVGLQNVTCLAVTPPSMTTDGWVSSGMEYEDVFAGVECSKIPLYVPKGSESLYSEADQWKDFMQIIGIEKNIESPITPATSSKKLIRNGNVYILTGDKTYTVTGTEVK